MFNFKGFEVADSHIHLLGFSSTPNVTRLPFLLLSRWPALYLDLVKRASPKAVLNFFPGAKIFERNYLVNDYVSDTRPFPVKKVVVIQSIWDDLTPQGLANEVRWTAEAFDKVEAQTKTKLIGIVGTADLASDRFAEALDLQIATGGKRFLGVRQMLAWTPDKNVYATVKRGDLMHDSNWQKGLDALAARDLSFDIWLYHTQLQDIAKVIETHPNNRFVLCHMGTPIGFCGPYLNYGTTPQARSEVRKIWEDGISRIAACKNVSVKVSGALMAITGCGFHSNPGAVTVDEVVNKLSPMINHIVKVFGPERCMFGSNFPVERFSVSYETLIRSYATMLASNMSEQTVRNVFFNNIDDIYLGQRATAHASAA